MAARFVTRFAPSPTGPLHLGHAFSALTAWDTAREAGGTCLLRIEDLDAARVRPEYEAAIYEDLAWLGVSWPKPVMRQSDRQDAYEAALEHLNDLGVIYPCGCTRADIRAALSAPQEGARPSTVYPGTCRGRAMTGARPSDAIRLDLARAFSFLSNRTLTWRETGPSHAGTHVLDHDVLRHTAGDVVLARKDTGTAAYHLAVVVDDAAQDVTHVVRGEDLLEATPIHRLLQALLELPVPSWHHHALVRDEAGKRLAKRSDAFAVSAYREAGLTPEDVRRMAEEKAE